MRPTVDPNILAALLARVEDTKRAWQKAKDAFWAVVGRPTGVPYQVIAAETFALNAYIEAMRQANRYLQDGTVPDHLIANSGKTRAAGAN